MHAIGLIHNPRANKNRRGKVDAGRLEKLLAQDGRSLFRSPANPDGALDAAVDEFYDKNIDIVASNGGDGTFQKVLTACLLRRKKTALPKFVVFKSGTVNFLASSFDMDGRPEDVLERLLYEGPGDFPTISITTLYVRSDNNCYYGLVFATATIYNFILEYNNPKSGETSVGKALRMIAKSVLRRNFRDSIIQPADVGVYVDGEYTGSGITASLLCGFRPKILGMKPFQFLPDLRNGIYEADTTLRGGRLVRALSPLYRGRPISGASYRSDVKSVLMSSDKIFGYTLDGELYNTHSVTVSPGPKIEIVKI